MPLKINPQVQLHDHLVLHDDAPADDAHVLRARVCRITMARKCRAVTRIANTRDLRPAGER
jgi:hypothetical protein